MKKVALLTGVILAAGFSAHATLIADWTFDTTLPATAGPFSPETGAGSASGSHAGAAVYSTPAGNGSAHSFSANTWAVNDFWQFQVSTVGLQGITLSYDQNGSGTGPSTFQVQYSTDGTSFTSFGSSYVLPAGVTWNGTTPNALGNTSFSDDLSTIVALNNASSVFIRLVDLNTTSIAGAAVGSGGTDRIDNVVISGVSTPEPSTMALLSLGGAAGAFFFGRRNRK
jgi:hypothetical protein